MASFCQQLCLLSGLFLRISLASFSTHSSSCPPEASLALPSETEKVLDFKSFEVAVVENLDKRRMYVLPNWSITQLVGDELRLEKQR